MRGDSSIEIKIFIGFVPENEYSLCSLKNGNSQGGEIVNCSAFRASVGDEEGHRRNPSFKSKS